MHDGLDLDTLEMTLDAIKEFAQRELPESLLIELDERDEFPAAAVKKMCSDELGVQLLFIAEEYGGMGGGAFDVYRVCEQHGRASTSASPRRCWPRSSAATRSWSAARPSSRQHWMSRIADEGLLMAYGATEPEAGSDLGALKTVAVPVVEDDGAVVGYRITGQEAVDQQRRRRRPVHRSSPTRPAGRPGSSSSATSPGFDPRQARGQARHPASATPPRCSSTTSRSTPIASSAASRARGWSRPSWCSATPA